MAWTYSWRGTVSEVPGAGIDAEVEYYKTEREAAEAALGSLRRRLDGSRIRILREAAHGADLLEDILALRRQHKGL